MCKSPGLLCSSKLEDNKALEVVASFPSTAVLSPASLLPSLLGLQSQICNRFDWTSEAQPELCGVGVQQCTGMLNAVFHTLSAAFWCIHWKKKKKLDSTAWETNYRTNYGLCTRRDPAPCRQQFITDPFGTIPPYFLLLLAASQRLLRSHHTAAAVAEDGDASKPAEGR